MAMQPIDNPNTQDVPESQQPVIVPGQSFGHYEGLIWGTISALSESAQTHPRPPSCNLCGTLALPPRSPNRRPKLPSPATLSKAVRRLFQGPENLLSLEHSEDYFLIVEAGKVTVVKAHCLLPLGRKAKFISNPQTARRCLPLLGALPEDYFLIAEAKVTVVRAHILNFP